MKVVILAGGLGSRISEESSIRPKPMVEIGGKPILWHIMKIYSAHGVNDFVICLGYKGYIIKEYFANYFLHTADVTFDLVDNRMEVHQKASEPWRVTLIDTGDASQTGGRLKRVEKYVSDAPFCLTYGDGVANVDVGKLVAHHQKSKRIATVTAVRPPGRFGALSIDGERVTGFVEKPAGDGGLINGGFFVLQPEAFKYLKGGDLDVWEREPLEGLARDGQLGAFHHEGFWQPMDTLRDKNVLEELWSTGKAPWKVW
ncbi:glucose-1-phosphate cytidylyltransferase [Usitatibacter palustris]|uniref:Glucose-1-phosphate cytidylyltransferase n=1 Tax=Usitatibacter palustris TaxID=2732487 RepID=A0A6M4HAB6_9PROT|nr:glucose-1-phosphate cytidylyltransferase [Usitatibacter palustris]QJR16506.1 Glucose-1-phosphate cytidylyltransferase [Usitatibacter palustris]